MAGNQYRDPFGMGAAMPHPALVHLRCGVLQHAGDRPADAGHSALCAAWVCDDNSASSGDGELRDVAAHCRLVALRLFEAAREAQQPFASERIHEELLLIDLLRRTEDFERAAERLSDLPKGIHDEERAIALRQQGWIALRDRAAHHAQERPQRRPSSDSGGQPGIRSMVL